MLPGTPSDGGERKGEGMTNEMEVSVHIKTRHSCGQIQERIYHLMYDQSFTIGEELTLPPLSIGKYVFTPPPKTFSHFTLEGYVKKWEIQGMDLMNGILTCLTCGANLLENVEEKG